MKLIIKRNKCKKTNKKIVVLSTNFDATIIMIDVKLFFTISRA